MADMGPRHRQATDSGTSAASKKSRGAEYKARLDATNVDLKQAEEKLRAAENDWNMAEHHPWEMASTFEQARSRFEAAKKSVELLRRQRDDIEDAARREGIPPGYLR
jgi:chromosome segregation ATPase